MLRFTGLLFLYLIVNSGCSKYKKEGSFGQSGIAITFDDDRIDNWTKHLKLLDSLGIKATFYISSYHQLNAAKKAKLKNIQNHGHEIAFHTTDHVNMVEYIVKYHHTMNELMQTQIESDLKKMNQDGFYPTSFAYPFGAHSGELDQMLKKYFKSVRALNGSPDYSQSLATQDKNYLLYGFGLDKSSNHSNEVVNRLIQSANDNHCCAIMVAHDINTSVNLSVTRERLISLAQKMKELNMKFYTVSEISQ